MQLIDQVRPRQMNRKGPEIFQRPLAEFTDNPEAPGAADEVLQRVILDYANRGFAAVVTIDEGIVRGIEPKEYLIGLLQQGFWLAKKSSAGIYRDCASLAIACFMMCLTRDLMSIAS